MEFTVAEVMEATAAIADRSLDRSLRLATVTTDSRSIPPSSLFVALRGERHDGHAFVADALAQGAAAAIVDRSELDVSAHLLLRVADSLKALGDLAAAARRRCHMRVVAITGSNGKTTTKNMIGAICEVAYPLPARILKTEGNLNNLVGLPLTLLRARGDEVVGVLEMGMNRPGEIARMTEIARPDFAVVTNVGRAHLEGLGSLAGVAAAKGEVYAGLSNEAVIVVNQDDEWVRRISADFAGRRVTFGREADVRACAVEDLGIDGVAFDLVIGADRERVLLPLVGQHNVGNALAAAAVAHAMDLPFAAIVTGLQQPTSPPMRMQVVRLSNDITVINDAYNANPTSMAAALEAIRHLPGRSVVVLGDMRELGPEGRQAHREIGALAASLGVHEIIAVGEFASELCAGAVAAGAAAQHVHPCASNAEAGRTVLSLWRPGDAILVKGSRSMRMEEIVQLLEGAGRLP